MSSLYESVVKLLGKTSLALDDENFATFLEHCSPSFCYSVSAFSRELGKDMVWLDHDRESFESLVKMLPQHVRLNGTFSRHVTVCDIDASGGDTAEVVSRLLVVYTNESGNSRTFATGRYLDSIQTRDDEAVSLAARKVVLETRDLGPGVHVPL